MTAEIPLLDFPAGALQDGGAPKRHRVVIVGRGFKGLFEKERLVRSGRRRTV